MVEWDVPGQLPAAPPVSLTVAVAAFRAVVAGDVDRDRAEVRAHVAFVERLLTAAAQDAVRAEFGGLLSSEREPC
jgi:hypothetical protein